MFDGKRYMTNGVLTKIPLYLQNILWYIVETMPEPKDHLQVFRLLGVNENGTMKQKIIHSQESPPYEKEYIISTTAIINSKVYIIDDETHSTMLLPDEY